MLSYPEGAGPPATAPHRALQMVRENLDYLERFSAHNPVTTQARHRPAERHRATR